MPDNDIRGKVKGILSDLYIKGNHEGFDKRNWGKLSKKCGENVSQALTQILEAVCGEMEKLKKIMIRDTECDADHGNGVWCNRPCSDKCKYYVDRGMRWELGDDNYNQAITDIQSLLRGTK